MGWRTRLKLAELTTGDNSDETAPFVISVTASDSAPTDFKSDPGPVCQSGSGCRGSSAASEHRSPGDVQELSGERWISWDDWRTEKLESFWAELKKKRAAAYATLPERESEEGVTTFRKAFFRQLSAFSTFSKSDLREHARSRGIPEEAALAFWCCKQIRRSDGGSETE